MIVLNAIKQLIGLNYDFVKDKFKTQFGSPPDNSKYESFFHKKEVLNGVFKGLKYVNFSSVCSTIYPKLLGSYEKEIQLKLIEIIKHKPHLVIDIGCAEGYYAVGLASILPGSQIIAADTSEEARSLCLELAEFNGCTNVTVTGTIDAEALMTYELKDTLIICDCEGYEKELFSEALMPYLKDTYLLIETHDFGDPSISVDLEKLFAKTHHIDVIASMDDLQKPKYYDYPELQRFSYDEKHTILAELRPKIMEWLILTPLSKN